ncbi:MAG: alkaline phosphatase family protein [Chitinophagaceae bacterium]|nr:alkaline phosphatase family protein [Chitinophagaceae bacterium]
MYRKNLLLIGSIFLSVLSFGQGRKGGFARVVPTVQKPDLARPKLVVGIVVDQMRWDYLYRYYDRYGTDGFRRMLGEGFTCENTLINYLPSFTAVGHTCVFTGSVPALDGISGNEWIEQLSGKTVYCTDDSTVRTVGADNASGKMSPRNLLVSTVTDELRLASNFQSKVVGVSLKDRAAILPAGHAANAAFWLDDATGNFVTSTYYMQELPAWADAFNKTRPIEKLIQNGWTTLRPIDTYKNSDGDDQVWEGRYPGETSSTFPHHIDEAYKKSKGTFRPTPFGNTLTLDFARQAVEGYQLGSGPATDFLTINCASTDYVGHMFGPNSIEVEDTYLRLDQDLGKFFHYLDARLGKGNYTVFLTADHGAAHAISYMQKHELPADFWNAQPLVDTLNRLLAARFGVDKLIRSGLNYQLNFDLGKIEENRLDFDAIKRLSVEYVQRQPGISFAVDVDKIGQAPVPEPLKSMIINGYNFRRSGAVQIVLAAGWFEAYGKTGTTHGTWNPYDTHIPLVFMGWGIRQGHTNSSVNMTDIAPTVAALLHIQMPNGAVGKPIHEITEK